MDIAGPSKAEEYYGGHGRGNQFYDFSGVEFLSWLSEEKDDETVHFMSKPGFYKSSEEFEIMEESWVFHRAVPAEKYRKRKNPSVY